MTEDLRSAIRDARKAVLKIVHESYEVSVRDIYAKLLEEECRREPAIRIAIWDLISTRQLSVRRDGILVAPSR